MSEEPERPAGEAEAAQEAVTVEVSMDTLDELLGAWGTCVGANEGVPGTSPPDAMGLILTYLPAVLEMAREFLIQQSRADAATGRLTRSAHRITDSGHN